MANERDRLEKLTVVALRDLAKKKLGAGTSKLRTKAMLVDALLSGSLQTASPGRSVSQPPPPKSKAKPAPIRVTKGPARSRTAARKPVENAAVPAVAAPAPSEPLLALPLDAQTLLVRWPASASGAAGERLELEVTSDGRPERTVPVAARSRHAYVRSLSAGPVYRARLVARSPDGRRRVIGLPSRPVVFFPQASAFRTAERFVHYAWAEPAASAQSAGEAAPGAPLPPDAELAALGLTRSAGGSATSPSGSTAGPVLGWLVSSRRPTSFAN